MRGYMLTDNRAQYLAALESLHWTDTTTPRTATPARFLWTPAYRQGGRIGVALFFAATR